MRTILIAAGAFMASCASAPEPQPPNAATVFDHYVESRGGRAALDRLRVVERIGWISVDTGATGLMAGAYHTCLRYPDRVAIEIDTGQWRLAQALRADGPRECEPGFTNCHPASEELADELVHTAQTANKDLLEEAELWRSATVSSGANGATWRLTLQTGLWAEFDAADGRLRALGTPTHWRRLGQWSESGGITFPHRLEDYTLSGGESDWRNTVHLAEVRVSDLPSPWCIERFGAG